MLRNLQVLLLLTGLGFSLSAPSVMAASLVMLERPGCVWCARWHEEIGPVLPKTTLGERAPLRRVNLASGWPADLRDIRREVVTPTFILLEDGGEVARLRGYPGEDFFWGYLERMIEQLDEQSKEQPTEQY